MMSELFDEAAQRADYNAAMKREMFAQGREEGRAEKAIEVARSSLALGSISKEDIAKATGLSLEKIEELSVQDSDVI